VRGPVFQIPKVSTSRKYQNMNSNTIEVNISDIKIGDRFRNDMGDLLGLAQSIREGQLLQPIGITPDHELVFGERRLLAYRDILGHKTIPARIIDVQSVLIGQIEENVLRKEFTITERIDIVDSLRNFSHGGDRRSDQARNSKLASLTLADACKLVGLSEDSYRRAKDVEENGVPELVLAMDTGKLSLHAAQTVAKASTDDQRECLTKRIDGSRATARVVEKQLRRIRNRKEQENDLARAIEAPKSDGDIQIHHCSFQDLEETTEVEPDSIALVCTDIPYGGDFLDQIEELGAFAERVLAPGGTFVTYSGHMYLPNVLANLQKHLTYRWAMASTWDGNANCIHSVNCLSQWKPVLVFSKGNWNKQGRWPDVLRVQSKEKDWHPWQQPLAEVESLVGYFSKPGDLVVDCCAGGFTTAIACLRKHRRFIGCDIDRSAVAKGMERLEAERHEIQSAEKSFLETDAIPIAG
jgi:ParB-like chromosome segregation protein Spo0J